MNKPKRWALRTAARIRQSLADVRAGGPSLALPETAWSQCARLARQINKAAGRGWTLAARRCRRELAYSIGTCRRHLEQVASELDGNDIPPRLPTPREVFRDLIALEDEFDEVRWDRKGILSVVTEPVILDSIDLGRFEIALDAGCGPHREWGTYEVIALDANPAASDPDVTHPHVQAGQLCEGEGRTAIRRALREGRVLDLFVLVRQILQTYNPSIAPAEDTVRIPSPEAQQDAVNHPVKSRRRRRFMPHSTTAPENGPSTNGRGRTASAEKADPKGVAALIDEAEAVRASLRDALSKTGRLVALLKQHKRQFRTIESTLAALRRLEAIEA